MAKQFDLAYNPNDPGVNSEVPGKSDPAWVRVTGDLKSVLLQLRPEHRDTLEEAVLLDAGESDFEDILANEYEGWPFVLMTWEAYEDMDE